MSAFMMNPETLSKITNFFMDYMEYKSDVFNPLPADLAYFEDYMEGDMPKRLYSELWHMNVEALISRYGMRSADMYDTDALMYGYLHDAIFDPDTEMYQAIKSIHCYLYQCSEGNLEGSALYQTVVALTRRICEQIVIDDVRWEVAKWGS